jgi:hypothetical protein
LAAVIEKAQLSFKSLEEKVLGYICYLENPTKEQLFELLDKSGTPLDLARNVAERLVLAKLVTDTGHYYLPVDKAIAKEAAAFVEPEIIKLLRDDI